MPSGKGANSLGGQPLPMADAAYSFQVTPRTPVAVLYWQGDDDFPPEAKILFDRSLAGYLACGCNLCPGGRYLRPDLALRFEIVAEGLYRPDPADERP